MSDLTKEKERLMKEVLGRKRAYEKEDAADLNQALDKMQTDLKKEYGVQTREDKRAIFLQAPAYIEKTIKGQNEAVEELVAAFRRPYVMGNEKSSPSAVILVEGAEGTGRHTSLNMLTSYLHQKQLFHSDLVKEIDLSRYVSANEEQVFLQDMYEALGSDASVICFENAQDCFPVFVRMIEELAVEGKMHLHKRYVMVNGVLSENQSGLVKNSVDALKAEGKYLVFMHTNGVKQLQDVFGNDFFKKVLDEVHFDTLKEDALQDILESKCADLIQKCLAQLEVHLEITPALKECVLRNHEKEKGVSGLEETLQEFYVNIADVTMKEEVHSSMKLDAENGVPILYVHQKRYPLPWKKNGNDEIESINHELDQIVGLAEVKKFVRSLEANAEINERRRRSGMKTAAVTRHMIFTGNPGTGKTTVARLIARYMKAAGILREGQLIEVSRGDLVAKYVGQTAPLTMSVIKSALGGILFIDEAYSLYRGKDDSFGLEAIDTLVKAMEDYRDQFIVILAGYKKEMESFLEANSGLKSRFPSQIEFPDYTGKELLEIACQQAEGKGYKIDTAVYGPLEKYFDQVQKERAAEAGNGRFARNVVEKAVLRQSERILKDDTADMSLLKEEDFILE